MSKNLVSLKYLFHGRILIGTIIIPTPTITFGANQISKKVMLLFISLPAKQIISSDSGFRVQNSVDKIVNNFYKNNTFLFDTNQYLTIFVKPNN